MTNKGKKVFVGMSGGVDSSVSAALLKQQGYDVTGVFMQVWQPDFLECSRGDDRRDAMRVAAHLDIPFLTFDFEQEYKEAVVDYMVREYEAGRTPNPDIMCNKHIKFGFFLNKALEMGADYIATGHYARTQDGKLLKGLDDNKDQTYFLWTLKKEQLQYVLFPVGEREKSEVRNIAREFGLANAEKKDSQGVCFMGQFTMIDFLEHYIPRKKGDLLNEKGEVVGRHEGAFYYTLGQRHGFTLTKKTPNDAPLYVVGKDIKHNTITVSDRKEQQETNQTEVTIKEAGFVSGKVPVFDKKYQAQIRYRQELQDCQIEQNLAGQLKVVFDTSQQAVATGQSLVLYDIDVCLGGGIII